MKTLSILFSTVWLAATSIGAAVASDAFWTSLPGIITSICAGVAVLLTAVGVFFSKLAAARSAKALLVAEQAKTDLKVVAKSIDGLLAEKTKADMAIGEKRATDTAIKIIKEMKDQPPTEK